MKICEVIYKLNEYLATKINSSTQELTKLKNLYPWNNEETTFFWKRVLI